MIPARVTPQLLPMAPEAIDKVRHLEGALLEFPQLVLRTEHLIHGGMYARTVRLQAGTVITGALIKLATIVIATGDCTVYVGGECLRLTGVQVLPASAGRKQVFVAHAPTTLTMIFPTQAKTVAEAEVQFTDEADRLLSHQQDGLDEINVTGE